MYRILALAAVAVVLPTSVLAQTAPTTSPTAAPATTPTSAPATVARGDRKDDKDRKSANGCNDITNLSSRGTTTYSACAVPKNHVLIQAGYNNLSAKNAGRVVTYPSALIRVGTSVPNLEFDVLPPSVERARPGILGRTTGTTDIGAGLTYQLPTGSAPFRASINTLVTAPTGDPGFGTRRGSDGQLGLNLGTTLGSFNIAGSASFRTTVDPITGLRYKSFVPSLMVADHLGFGKNPGSVFVEAARFSRVASYGTDEMLYTAGYKQPLSKRAMLDAEYSQTPNLLGFRAHSIGGGVSFLF